LLKLTACNLFWEAIACLGVSKQEIRLLPDAKYVVRNSKRVAQHYAVEIRERAIAIVEACQPIQPLANDVFQLLNTTEGIDPGEALLISAAHSENAFYLVTGDKRCLMALADAPQLNKVRQKLCGKVVCLEQLVQALIAAYGFENIAAKVITARQHDGALNAVFGSAEQATQANVSLALAGYIKDLRLKTGTLLRDF
jgi:predicted nucleic acid-binding protein